jgi:hypothetical protein
MLWLNELLDEMPDTDIVHLEISIGFQICRLELMIGRSGPVLDPKPYTENPRGFGSMRRLNSDKFWGLL